MAPGTDIVRSGLNAMLVRRGGLQGTASQRERRGAGPGPGPGRGHIAAPLDILNCLWRTTAGGIWIPGANRSPVTRLPPDPMREHGDHADHH